MRVEIVSIMAALAGRDSIVWTGDVEIAFPEFAASSVNAHLFRYFNRVDDEDAARLEAIGYRLPSLSVGDLVHWNGKTWRVAGLGFDLVTGDNDYVTALALYALKSAAEAEGD